MPLSKYRRSEKETQPPGARCPHLPQLPKPHTHSGVSQASLRGGSPWGWVLVWVPGMEVLPAPPRLRVPSQALPGAQVGRDGEDAGQSRDDTAHVGDEGQVLPVHGVHLHGGHLGPRDGLGLASVSPLGVAFPTPRVLPGVVPGGHQEPSTHLPRLCRLWSQQCVFLGGGLLLSPHSPVGP